MKREKKLQNQLWKERMPLIASFFLPFFILTVICILHDVYPFAVYFTYRYVSSVLPVFHGADG